MVSIIKKTHNIFATIINTLLIDGNCKGVVSYKTWHTELYTENTDLNVFAMS